MINRRSLSAPLAATRTALTTKRCSMVRTLKYTTLLLMLLMWSSAAMAQIGLSIHDTSAASGSKLVIPIYVDSTLTGKGVTSYQIQLSYNYSYMAFDSVIATGSLSQSLGLVSFNVPTPGTLTIASAGSTPLAGTGVLIYVRFRLMGSGGVSLAFSGGTAENFFNEGSPAIVFRNGSINILPAPSISVYPASSLLTVGDQQQFNAYSGVSPYHWSLTNPSVASIDSSGLLTATNYGFTKVVARDFAGTIDTISGVVSIRAFRLSVRDTSYIQGQTFNLPIYTSSLTGLNVTSGSFQIQFNQSILTPIGVNQTGTLLASYSAPLFNNVSSGILNVSFAGTTPLTGAGILVYLQFKVSKTNSGGSGLYPANIIFNENFPGDSATGNFQTINLATLNINPPSGNLIDGDTLRFTATGGTPPYTWSTNDSTIASISNSGLLTALKGGSVVVQAVDTYGGSGVSGTIQIYDTRVSIPDTMDMVGDSINIPVTVSPLTPGMHVQSFQATITFDSSVVHAVGIVNTGTLTNGWTYTTNISGTQMVFAGAGAVAPAGPGVFCTIRFVVPPYVASGRVSSLNLQQLMINEGTPRAFVVNGNITTAAVGVPAAPTSLNAVVINYGRIDLSWQDNANNETSYTLQRTTDTTASWSNAAILPANTTSDFDSGLVDGTKYFYRVFGSNSSGNSGFSNVVSGITPMRPPTNLNVSQIPGGEIKLTWQDNSNSEVGYYIERKLGSSGTYAVIDSVGANVSTYTDTKGVPGNDYFYRVRGYNLVCTSTYSNEVNLTLTGVKSNGTGIPDKFDVSQNYPNPFNPSTVITYQVPVSSVVTLKVYDMLGKEIRTLVNESKNAGYYSAVFVASNLPSGVYFYRMQAGKYSETKKLTVLK